jgi:hypothetical protein
MQTAALKATVQAGFQERNDRPRAQSTGSILFPQKNSHEPRKTKKVLENQTVASSPVSGLQAILDLVVRERR